MMQPIKQTAWQQHPAFSQLLGICPLLAMSHSVVLALALGLATLLMISATFLTTSLLRNTIPAPIRLPVLLIVAAILATILQLLAQAFALPLALAIGIFLPLIAVNGLLLQRAHSADFLQSPLQALRCGLLTGSVFAALLLICAVIRELLGTGSLFAGMELLFGDAARHWQITLWANYPPFLLWLLPPGAFIVAGLVLAAINAIALRGKLPATDNTPSADIESRRARVTGRIT